MSKKLTIVEQFAEIVASAKAGKVLTAEQIKFIEERAGKIADKNAKRKPTKVQEQNELIKAEMLKVMKLYEMYTITDLMKLVQPAFPDIELSNQKISALATQLVNAKVISRIEGKGGKALFQRDNEVAEVNED